MHNEQTIDAQALDLMLRAGSRWVLWLLIILSIAAAAVVLERLWYFLRERRPRRQIAEMLEALRTSGAKAALKALGDVRSLDAAVARACLDHLSEGAPPSRSKWRRCLNPSAFATSAGWLISARWAATRPSSAVRHGARHRARLPRPGPQQRGPGHAGGDGWHRRGAGRHGGGSAGRNSAVATYNVLMRHVETALASAGTLGHRILAHVKAEHAAHEEK